MNVITITPTAFLQQVLKANDIHTFQSPSLTELTPDKFIVFDELNRDNYITGDKIDLSGLGDVVADLSYMSGELIEDVVLEAIPVGTEFSNGIVTDAKMPETAADQMQLIYSVFVWMVGLDILNLGKVSLSSIPGVLIAEITENPYFKGTLKLPC